MTDYISRQDAIDALCQVDEYNSRSISAIKHLPSAHLVNDSQGDYIRRQDAIYALAVYIHNVDKVMGNGLLSEDDCKDSAHSVLDDVPSAQRWIPCSERLPEEGVEVMTTFEIISNGKTRVEQGSYLYHGWCLAYDNLRLASHIRVIAWMPLPEPYGGGYERGRNED